MEGKWLKISIVTASYNSAPYIEDTVQSVRKQTYPHVEHIVVDGGSTDGTVDILKPYLDQIDLITEPDEGIYDAFNKGIRMSSGDIIYFLNSDDYLYDQETIAHVAKIFIDHPSVGMVYGNIQLLNEASGCFEFAGQKVTLEDVKKGIIPFHPAFFARKALLVEAGGFDLQYRIASDTDLMIKLIRKHEDQLFYLNRTISVFRVGGISTNEQTGQRTLHEKYEVIRKHFGIDLTESENHYEKNMRYYKKWLEFLLVHHQPISRHLYEQGVRRVALFGTRETSLYMMKDLEQSRLRTVALLDNHPLRQGRELNGVQIHSLDWLKVHAEEVDAIIFTFEGNYENEVRRQLEGILQGKERVMLSWKELLALSYDSVGRGMSLYL